VWLRPVRRHTVVAGGVSWCDSVSSLKRGQAPTPSNRKSWPLTTAAATRFAFASTTHPQRPQLCAASISIHSLARSHSRSSPLSPSSSSGRETPPPDSRFAPLVSEARGRVLIPHASPAPPPPHVPRLAIFPLPSPHLPPYLRALSSASPPPPPLGARQSRRIVPLAPADATPRDREKESWSCIPHTLGERKIGSFPSRRG
jgi:hypothetical protein